MTCVASETPVAAFRGQAARCAALQCQRPIVLYQKQPQCHFFSWCFTRMTSLRPPSGSRPGGTSCWKREVAEAATPEPQQWDRVRGSWAQPCCGAGACLFWNGFRGAGSRVPPEPPHSLKDVGHSPCYLGTPATPREAKMHCWSSLSDTGLQSSGTLQPIL